MYKNAIFRKERKKKTRVLKINEEKSKVNVCGGGVVHM